MKEEPPTLRNIVQEFLTDGYYNRARERASHRKSLWNLLLVILMPNIAALAIYALFHVMWWINVAIYPDHAGKLGEFWSKDIHFPASASNFLFLMPLLFASVPIGMIAANFVVWIIPPARRALDKEAEGVKWASFKDATSGLWAIGRIMVPICLLLSLIGAASLH